MNPPQLSRKPKILKPFHVLCPHYTHTRFPTPETLNKNRAGPGSSPFSATSYVCNNLEELTSDPSPHHL